MTDANEPDQQTDDTVASPSQGPDETLADVKVTLKALGLQDKLILFGSIALAVLFLLPWWSFSSNIMGVTTSSSVNGLQGAAWLGWIAAIAATILALTKAGILRSMPVSFISASKSTGIFVVLTGVALLAGPLYFWSTVGGDVPAGMEQVAGIKMGKTFFFFLALLAALAAAAGAVWKLMEERKATSSE